MRTLLSSCLALAISQASLASLTPDAAGEDLNLASSPSVPFLFGPLHATQALELYKSKDYIGAVQSWQAALKDGYNFLLNDLEHVVPYTKALRYIDLQEKAYVTWEWFLKQPHTRINPVWYKHYATCAVDTAHYAQTLDALNKYLELGGAETPHTLFLAAQSHSLLDHNDEAVRAWRAYFCAEDPALVPVGCYFNAAGENFHADKYRQAAKYMTIALERATQENVTLRPDTVALAARIYFVNKDVKNAAKYWSLYFKMPDAQPSNMDYASAGMAFDASDDFEVARDVFEKYLAATPPEHQSVLFLFGLGRIYASLGDAQKSAACFERVLSAPAKKQMEISNYPRSWFMSAVATYVVTNNKRDLVRMAALHDRLKPRGTPSLLNYTIEAPKGRSNPRMTKKTSMENTVQAVHAHLRQVETKKCHDLQGRLKKISFAHFDQAQAYEDDRINHLSALDTLLCRIPNSSASHSQANSSQGPEPMTILSIQREVSLLERGCESLERAFQNARHEKSKQNALAYLRSLGTGENELDAFVPTQNPNLRSLYGHAKPSAGSHGPDFEGPSSSSQEPCAASYVRPEVMFSRLKSIEVDLTTLQSVPGLKAKYDLFMAEIAQDPFAQTLKSGKVKALVGEKGLFSRRLDDANRLVYRVEALADGRVHASILSVLGHYKNLKSKMAQTSVVTQKAPKPAKSAPKKGKSSKKKRR